MTAAELSCKLTNYIINPLIALLFAAAVLVFAWGVLQFISGLASGEQSKEEGRKHMLWGLVGLLVMTVATAIIHLTVNSIGATKTFGDATQALINCNASPE